MNINIARSLQNNRREVLLSCVILILSLIFYSKNNVFLSWDNVASILSNYAVFGIMAIGMMIVISTGNIDVSVGAQLAVISMIVSILVTKNYVNHPVPIILISLGIGIVLGLINGILVAIIKLPAIIVTLGSLNIMRGSLLLIAGSQWVSGLPQWFTSLARTIPFDINLKITAYCWLFVNVLTYLIINHTVIGRLVIATGSNPGAAIRIGSNPANSYIFAFAYMGMLTGLGSLLYTANVGMAQPVAGIGYEMILIAAVVIGGTSFSGGNISILGTFLGVVLLGVIENGMIISKVPVYWQEMVRGFVIIISITSSTVRFIRRRRRSIIMSSPGESK